MIHSRVIGSCLLLASGLVGCQPDAVRSAVKFRNVANETDYTGDVSCASCHVEQYDGFQSHGMARSFYAFRDVADSLWSNVDTTIVHAATGLRYRVVRIGSELIQEEIAHGVQSESLSRRADFVVGSGSAAATFLTATNGRLFEMPVSWYTRESHWDFSPGYRLSNARFDRQIPDRCMACHNSYPGTTPWVDGKYTSLPDGIGCERCHGPGKLHVVERLEMPEPPSQIDDSIVNPKHLELDLRLAVCEQCHLQTTVSVLRRGRGAFDFRPSERLSDHLALFFDPAESQTGETIAVISHAERMQKSACFTKTQRSSRPLECITCHNPHEGFRDKGPEYFNATCKSCHAPDVLVRRVVAAHRNDHAADSQCFSCHMPRREADDAPHASFTDHWIRTRDGIEPQESSTEPLLPYFERDKNNREGQTYLGMALIVHGRQTNNPRMMATGVATAEAGLRGDTTWSEAHLLRGLAYHQLGRPDLGVGALELAARVRPDSPQNLDALAQTYEALRHSPSRVLSLYREALEIQPALSDVRANYAYALHRKGEIGNAIAEYRKSLEELPWVADVHVLLGAALLQQGHEMEASTAFNKAAHLNPFLGDALRSIIVLSEANTSAESIALFDGLAGSASSGDAAIARPAPAAILSARGTPARVLVELPPGGGARVLTARGLQCATIAGHPITGIAPWDLTDETGATLPSGIYLLQTRGPERDSRFGYVSRLVIVTIPSSQ